jgi:hypothetical protein
MDKCKVKFFPVKNKGCYVYLPLKLIQDSSFPLSVTGKTHVARIFKDKLVIE